MTHAALKPCSAKPTVARSPAPPAPTTMASYVWSMMGYAPTVVKFLPLPNAASSCRSALRHSGPPLRCMSA